MNTITRGVLTLLCGCLLAFAAADARGAISIEYSFDGTDYTVAATDGGAFVSFSELNVSEGANSWTITSSSATRADGPPASLLTDQTTFVKNTSGSASTIYLRFSATDYTFPALSPPDLKFVSTVNGQTDIQTSGGPNSQVVYQSWLDADNLGVSSGSITSGSLGPISLSGFGNSKSFDPLSATVIGPLDLGADGQPEFSISAVIRVTLDNNDTMSFQTSQSVSPVPEPASLALWSLLGFAAVGGAAIRRRRRGRWSDENRLAIQGVIDGK